MIVEELIARLGFKFTGSGDLKQFQNGLQGAQRGLSSFQATVAGFAGGIAAGAAYQAISTLGRGLMSIPKGAIETGAKFEKLGNTLEIIEGSSEKAKESLDWVTDFATKTPYDLDQVASAFVKMKSYGLDPMDGSFSALGDAASAMGKDFGQAVEAMADATTGENERLKEFGVTSKVAGDQVTYSWRQNGKAMKKTVKKDAGEISKALTEIFEGRFKGAMEKQSKSFDGIMSNIGDAWDGFKRMVADAGWFEYVKGLSTDLLNNFLSLAKDGTLKRWAGNISTGLIEVGRVFVDLIKGAKAVVTEILRISAIGDPDFNKLKVVLVGLALLFAPIGSAVILLGLLLQDFVKYMNGEVSATGWVIDKLKEAWNLFVADVKKVNQAFLDFEQFIVDFFKRLIDKVVTWKEGFIETFANIDLIEAGKAMMLSLLNGIIAGAKEVIDYVTGLGARITGIFKGLKFPSWGGGGGAGEGAGDTSNGPGMSSPASPGLKQGASLTSPNQQAYNDNKQITVNVASTNATPAQIAAAVANAGGSKPENVFYTTNSAAEA